MLEVLPTPKIYNLGSTRTNKSFKLRYGSSERNFRYEFISTQDFTTEEFTKWKEACETANIVLPTLEEISKKEQEIRDANIFQFNESDVEHVRSTW